MTATTPRYVIPYPQGTDRVMDGDNAMQAIAERVEAILAPVDDRSLVAGSSARNVIRNGDMGVWQRGAGPFTVDGFTADGYWCTKVGGTLSAGRGVIAPGGGAAKYALNVTVAGQAAAGDFMHVSASIEGVETLAGRQVTLSFDANAASGTPKIGVECIQYFGTGGSPSATVQTAVQAVQVSAVNTRYAVTFTVPSIAGKTLGTNGNDYLGVRLWLSAGATFASNASAIGIQNATWSITRIQLEAGPTATPFERLPQQQQLAWCQRYYWRESSSNTESGLMGTVIDANSILINPVWPVPMRAKPTLGNPPNPTVFIRLYLGGTFTVTQNPINPQYATTRDGKWIWAHSGLGVAVGNPLMLATTGGYLEASAEL